MCCSSWLLTCACTACDAVDVNVSTDDSRLYGWQQGELYTRGEATRIGYVTGTPGYLAMCLGQSVDIVVIAFNAKVLGEVYYPDSLWDFMFTQKLLALAMAEAEKYHVDFVPGHCGCKFHFCLANESFVNFGNLVACIALGVCKNYLCIRVVEQEAYQLASCISRRPQDAYTNLLGWGNVSVFHRDGQDNTHAVLLMSL